MHIPFSSPTTIGIFGPSQVGKSFLLSDLLIQSDIAFSTKPEWILYCYSVKLLTFPELKNQLGSRITFHQGVPTRALVDEVTQEKKHGIIVLDDLMVEVCSDLETSSLFTIGSHHLNITVVFIGQNLFPGGKFSRSISLNLHYLILFKNLADAQQIKTRARQIFPNKTKQFMEIFNDATAVKYGYLLLDLSPNGDEELRIRSNISPGEVPIIYKFN